MKIFIDTADLAEIRDVAAMGVVDGVTTNPTLIAKAGRPLDVVIRDICEIVDGPISAEGDRFFALLMVRALTYGPEYAFGVGCRNDSCRARGEGDSFGGSGGGSRAWVQRICTTEPWCS